MQIVAEYKKIRIILSKDDKPKGFEDASDFTFPYSIYARLSKAEYEGAFNEVNAWLKDMPAELRQRLFRFYSNCINHVKNTNKAEPLLTSVNSEVKNIDDILDYRNINKWNKTAKAFPFVHLEEIFLIKKEDLVHTTYSSEEAYALNCMSVCLKLITPIFGTLVEAIRNETGSDWKERKVVEILKGTQFVESAPYAKLEGYCQGKADPMKNRISPAAKKGVTPSSLGPSTLAWALVKCVATYSISSPKDVVRRLYQETKTHLDYLCGESFHDKTEAGSAAANAEDGDGVAQQWRRSQDMTPAERAMLTSYIGNISYMKRDMKLAATDEQIENAIDRVMSMLNDITQLHLVLMARAFVVDSKPIISLPGLAVVKDKNDFRRAQACAHLRLIQLGCPVLADVLICDHMPRDPGDMTFTSTSIYPYTDEDLDIFVDAYPLVNRQGKPRDVAQFTPAYQMCEKIVAFCKNNHINTKQPLLTLRKEFVSLTKNL